MLDYLGSAIKTAGSNIGFGANLAIAGFARQDKRVEKSKKIIELATQSIKDILAEVPNAMASSNEKTKDEVNKLAALLDKYKQKINRIRTRVKGTSVKKLKETLY